MKNPFIKKSQDEYDSYDSYDDSFYRGEETEEDGVVEDDVFATEAPAAPAAAPATATGNTLKVVKPRSSADGRDVADYLVKGHTVVMNIEELERADTLRIIDFLLGTLYVLGGELRRVTKTTLVLSPRTGEMSGDDDQDENDD